jgi:hypothetical protein
MNNLAITMLLISVILLWGGLILATIHLIKNPDEAED